MTGRCLALAALVLSGCSTGVFVQKDPMKDALAQLTVGASSRADVVALLGEPFVSFPERGVDVFQRAGSLVDVLLPPIPYETEFTYYTLISYDASGLLTGIDSGGYVYRSELQAGRFRFHMGWPGLLVEQELRPAYRTHSEACTLVMLLVGNRWSDGLYYKEPVRLNGAVLDVHADYSSYLYVAREPGAQELSVTWTGRNGPWSHSRGFDCAAGDLLYVTLTDDRDGEPILVSRNVPAAVSGRGLVLYPPPTAAPFLPLE